MKSTSILFFISTLKTLCRAFFLIIIIIEFVKAKEKKKKKKIANGVLGKLFPLFKDRLNYIFLTRGGWVNNA